VLLKIQISGATADGPISHPANPAQHAGQVSGHKPDKALEKNCSTACESMGTQDFSIVTRYGNETLNFREYW